MTKRELLKELRKHSDDSEIIIYVPESRTTPYKNITLVTTAMEHIGTGLTKENEDDVLLYLEDK